MAKREKESYVIQSVTNALNLLEEFKGDRDELGVTVLSKRLNLHKNNIFRLLATLEAKGYIEQNKATERNAMKWLISGLFGRTPSSICMWKRRTKR